MCVPGYTLAIALIIVQSLLTYGSDACKLDIECPEEYCKKIFPPGKCPQCVCDAPPSCSVVLCPVGTVCVMKEVPCKKPPCIAQPDCVPRNATPTIKPCPQIKCLPTCVPATGPDGCPKCKCPPTCETVKCSAGYECRLIYVICIRPSQATCFPQPKCVPTINTSTIKPCPKIKCVPPCEPDIGPYGCPICACPPTCATVDCLPGNECVLVNVTCVRPPCFPQPYCRPIPTKNPCQWRPRCALFCDSGYKTDKNGCQLCECNPEESRR